MIRIERDKFNELIIDEDLINSNLDNERLDNELFIIDFINHKIESKLYRDFDIYNENQISIQNIKDFEIILNREYSLYYDKEDDLFHYFFEISDIDNEDEIIFSIEIFNEESENLDRIYELIKNYINYLIDYNKNL